MLQGSKLEWEGRNRKAGMGKQEGNTKRPRAVTVKGQEEKEEVVVDR